LKKKIILTFLCLWVMGLVTGLLLIHIDRRSDSVAVYYA